MDILAVLASLFSPNVLLDASNRNEGVRTVYVTVRISEWLADGGYPWH